MKLALALPTTEHHEWITLRFRVSARRRTLRDARAHAVAKRRNGFLARVRRDPDGGWLVAVYFPRRNRPRRCDLIV